MLPLLEFAEGRLEHTVRETIDALADAFALTPEERKQLLPSRQQEVFGTRSLRTVWTPSRQSQFGSM